MTMERRAKLSVLYRLNSPTISALASGSGEAQWPYMALT